MAVETSSSNRTPAGSKRNSTVQSGEESLPSSDQGTAADPKDIWVELNDPTSDTSRFFVNLVTGQSSKSPPSNSNYRSASSDQWWELWDSNTQRYYYFNTFTRQTVWHRPTSPSADIIPLAKIQALQLANQNNSSSNNANITTATSNIADTSKVDPNLSHNGNKSSTHFHNHQQFHHQQTAVSKVPSNNNATRTVTNESAINDANNTALSSLISNVQQNCNHESAPQASSSHHAPNLAQNSCSKPNCHKQMSSTSTASKATCHRHNHSRHRHDNHHGTHKHRHRNNNGLVNQATNVGTGDSVASFATGMQTIDSNDSLIAAANNVIQPSGNNSGSINRTSTRQKNSGLSRASSEHRRHHGRSSRSGNAGQRTLGHNQSSAASNVNPNQYEISPGSANAMKTSVPPVGVNGGRFLRSGCFGCNMQNAKGCAHDCNNSVPPVPARGQESQAVASGTIGSTSTQSRRSSHNHHHHRCNKHRRHHPQHSHHTQTHTPNHQMDEATREIINRSLQANNMNNSASAMTGSSVVGTREMSMTPSPCGHGVSSGNSANSSAVNHQAVQNQSCHRHLPQQPSVEQDVSHQHQGHYNSHNHQHHLQQQQITSRQQQQTCHHDSTLKATTGANGTPPISRKAPPPLPRNQPPPPPLPHQHSLDSGAMMSVNASSMNQEVLKPQNVIASENRAMGGGGAKARAQMPLPVPLDNSGALANNQIVLSTTSPPFSNYAINGSTPSPISGNNSLGKTKNKSPSAQTKDKQHMFHLSEPNSDIPQHEFGSPNPFQTTTHVNVPNQRTGALSRNNSSGHSFKSGCKQHQNNSKFLAANSVHIEPSNSFTFNQNPMLDNQVNQKKVGGMTQHVNKVALSGTGENNPTRSAFDRNQQLLRRSATPHLDPMTYMPSAQLRNQEQRHFHHNPNVGAIHLPSSSSSNPKCQPLSDCNPTANLSCFQLTNNTNNHINLSSDNLIRSKNDVIDSLDDFPLVDDQNRNQVNENALNRNQQLPFRYCKSYTDLISDPNFNSDADLQTQKYTDDYENLKNPSSISTDALYENTNNAAENCQSCGSNRNSRNPFRISDCCQRYSQGSQDLIGGSKDGLDSHRASRIEDQFMFNQPNIGSNFASNQQVEVYETLSNYTSSMLYENTRHQFQAPKIVQKDVKPPNSRTDEADLIGRIYDQVASDEEERNLMENLENLSVDNDDEDYDDDVPNHDVIDRDLMFDDDEFESYNNGGYNNEDDNDYNMEDENEYNENESELLATENGSNLVVGSLESGPDYVNTTMSSDTRESVYSVGAKFTPPSSRDILAAVDSKLGRKWAQSRSSNSPARPPKSSNLEMSPAIAGAANVGASAINQQACGVGMSNDPSNKRASIYSQDSLVTSPSRTTNATFSSKESMLSTPSDTSEQSRSINFTGQFSISSSSDHRNHHSNNLHDTNFEYHKFPQPNNNNPSNSKEANLLYTIETETEIECNDDNGTGNSREGNFGSWDSSRGNGESGNGQHIYDQPHVEQEYLLYEPAHEYDDPYVSDSLTRHLGRGGNKIYENSSLTSDETNFLASLALPTVEPQQSPVLSKDKGTKYPSSQVHVPSEPGKVALSSHQTADGSPLSSRVATATGNLESSPLNLTRKAGLFKKKQSTSDVMKWTKDVIREPLIADKRYKKEAIECFKLVQQYMGDRKVTSHQSNYQINSGSFGSNSNTTNNRTQSEDDAQINCALELASRGWENAHLRDELILQVCKQSIDNSKQSSVRQGWELLAIFLTFFAPCEQRIVSYLENFLNDFTRDEDEVEEEGTNSGSGGGMIGPQSDELSFHLPNDEILPPGLSSTLEKLCSIPVKKYALHCGKQLNRVVTKNGVQDSCKMRRPTLEEIMAARSGLHQQGLFGSCLCDLMDAQRDSELKHIKDLQVPWVLKALIGQIVSAKGHLQEGILRVSGDSDLSQKLKVELNSYAACNPPEGDKFWLSYDTHVLAGVLKQWLRQLDEPLIPMELYSQCIACVSNNDVIGVVKLINSHQMFEPNKTVLRYLIAFLQIIVDESESNKMTSRNIALVIAPNCLWSESRDPQTLLQNSQCEMAVIQALIENMSDTEELKRQIMQNFDI
ncbi:uncharacterized protein LOC142348215 isoform X2 [Convolutriloba macropyga]|uniref:uncharacterized protein LOC142348215 isoform X2 n=1 Tax=Convolutriloba macropyga TaxID=536237 RepID=UPI003F528645